MLTIERINAIKQLLVNQGSVKVADLSTRFNVTPDLIRKDLTKLQNEGFLHRVHGGAMITTNSSHPASFSARFNSEKIEKIEIASKAIDTFENHNSIFLDNSTICVMIAKQIVSTAGLELSVFTNSFNIALLLKEVPFIKLTFIGGDYSAYHECTLGFTAVEQISQYNFDKSYIGASGINFTNQQLTVTSCEEGKLKFAVIHQSALSYALIPSNRLSLIGNYNFCSLNLISMIITDKHLEEDQAVFFRENDIFYI